MKSKAEVIRQYLAGKRVLDIGGAGYGEDNPYERELRDAWSTTANRTTVDRSEAAMVKVDFNALPLPPAPSGTWDYCTLFDVLEHLDHPANVLRWVPTPRILVCLPNALSSVTRRMEESGFEHQYSFTPYTASVLMKRGGWRVDECFFTMGKWSLKAKIANAIGSLMPSKVATGILLHCSRIAS